MDYKNSLKSRSARSSVSYASSASATDNPPAYGSDSRRSSIISDLSMNSFSGVPAEERVTLFNLQNQKNHLRIMTGLQKLKKAKSAAVKQSEYMIHNPDPIAKNLVCDGRNFTFNDFKSQQDSKTLKDLASRAESTTNPWYAEHQARVAAFARTYNCVFVDAEGKPSLGYRFVKSERSRRHRHR